MAYHTLQQLSPEAGCEDCNDGNCHISSLLHEVETVNMKLVNLNGNCTVYPGSINITEFTTIHVHECINVSSTLLCQCGAVASVIIFVLHHGFPPSTMETSVVVKF